MLGVLSTCFVIVTNNILNVFCNTDSQDMPSFGEHEINTHYYVTSRPLSDNLKVLCQCNWFTLTDTSFLINVENASEHEINL